MPTAFRQLLKLAGNSEDHGGTAIRYLTFTHRSCAIPKRSYLDVCCVHFFRNQSQGCDVSGALKSRRTVDREYLLALCTAEDLMARGATCVLHGQSLRYYKALLEDPSSADRFTTARLEDQRLFVRSRPSLQLARDARTQRGGPGRGRGQGGRRRKRARIFLMDRDDDPLAWQDGQVVADDVVEQSASACPDSGNSSVSANDCQSDSSSHDQSDVHISSCDNDGTDGVQGDVGGREASGDVDQDAFTGIEGAVQSLMLIPSYRLCRTEAVSIALPAHLAQSIRPPSPLRDLM